MSVVDVARGFAKAAHQGQTDLSGKPYWTHLERVAERVRFCGNTVEAVAWLHDVVEDTDITLTDVAALFDAEIVAAVDAMTQRPNEPLESYWTRVKANEIAFIVKLHGDMPDNNDPERHKFGVTPEQSNRIREKYARAIKFFAQQGPTQAPSPCGPPECSTNENRRWSSLPGQDQPAAVHANDPAPFVYDYDAGT